LNTNKDEIFKNIINVNAYTAYNCNSKSLETKFYFETDEKGNTHDWDMKYQEYIRNLSVGYIDETIITKFIDINEISTITIDNKTININNSRLKLKDLKIYCNKNKFLNLSFPRLDIGYLPGICHIINVNRRSTILEKYNNNLVDNIIVFPSNNISEIKYYENLKEEDSSNVLACFNYKAKDNDETFLIVSDLITKIIKDFYKNNQYLLDRVCSDSKKIVIAFTNNKSITIYDKEYINQNNDFLNKVYDDLIDIKTKNVKRKVYGYGKHNNGKNGKFM